MRKGGKILLVIGLIVLVVSVVAGVILAVVNIGGAAKTVGELETFSGSTEYSAEAGEEFQLYYQTGNSIPMCEVVGADGSEPQPGGISTSTIGDGDESWTSFDSYKASSAQTYTITCDSDSDAELAVGPPLSVAGIFAGVGGILLAAFGGGFGFVLAVVGLILLLVGRSKAKAAPVQ
jgi:hypothetical protein